MDIKNLDTFIQAAELQSFTKAAEKLGYSQSTVSFQIKQLENTLGVPLFERVNHTVSLTEKGREVLQYAGQISGLAKQMEKQLKEEEKEIGGHIRIAMADSICRWLFQEHYETFHRRYPGITMKVIAASTEEMFRLLNQNEVDLVYTLDHPIYHAEYKIAYEDKVSMHFVAGKDCPLCRKTQVAVEEVVQYPFLLTEKGMSYRRMLEEKLARLSLEVNPALEIGDADLLCSLAEKGMGISFLPDYVTEKAEKEGRITYLKVEDFEIDIWKQLLYHRGKWLSAPMQAAIAYLGQKRLPPL